MSQEGEGGKIFLLILFLMLFSLLPSLLLGIMLQSDRSIERILRGCKSQSSSLLRVSCYLTLQPFQPLRLGKQPLRLMSIFAILQERFLLHNFGFNLFQIVSSRPNSVYICIRNVLFNSGLLFGLICSFRKEILSSIICCSVFTIIYYLMKSSTE